MKGMATLNFENAPKIFPTTSPYRNFYKSNLIYQIIKYDRSGMPSDEGG